MFCKQFIEFYFTLQLIQTLFEEVGIQLKFNTTITAIWFMYYVLASLFLSEVCLHYRAFLGIKKYVR